MSDENGPPSKRLKIEKDELEKLSKDDLLERWIERETFIDALLSTKRATSESNDEIISLRESEEKLKQQQIEASRRENVLVMRLTAKEQEMQEYINQITELKQAHSPQMAPLRNMLLDPAVNLLFQRMKKEMDVYKDKLEQAQNDLAAWKFTPDSQTGKRLMAKCRMVLSENEELGKIISSGRTAKLEGEIALGKKFVEEMKTSQAETDEFLVEMDEDVEGMQSTIYVLQQQLKDTKEQITALQKENETLRSQTDHKIAAPRTLPPEGSTNKPPAASNAAEGMDTSEPGQESRVSELGRPTHLGQGSSVGSTATDSNSSGTDSRTNCQTYDTSSSQSYNCAGQPHTQQLQTASTPRPATTNGDHHVAMETDTSEGPPESCDDESSVEHRQHTSSQAKASTVYNHASQRTSQSSEGAYTLEGTDVSSEAWSPTQTKPGSGGAATDDQSGLVSEQYRTGEGKAGGGQGCGGPGERDSLTQNGLVNSQYDSQGDDGDT